MSLSSLLLGTNPPIDSELDNLFKVPVAKVPIPGPSKETPAKKRKLDQENEASTGTLPKRSKSSAEEHRPMLPKSKASKKTNANPPKADERADENYALSKKVKGKGKEKEATVESDEDDEQLENAYLKGQTAAVPRESKNEDSESEDDEDPTKLVHEAVERNKKVRAPKRKYVPQGETAELRDQRTVFVGNLPIEMASKKSLQKQLKHHIISFLPTAKIESIRFRSIPFQAPTAKMPTSDDEGDNDKTKKSLQASRKEPRAHDKERTSVWRSKLDEEDEISVNKDDKRYLNPAQKKKIAFINQEFHSSAGTVNAYIVFAHPLSLEGRPANLPPPPPIMDPYQAARSAAEKCDGTFFMERMVRVDFIVKNKTALTNDEAAKSAIIETDPRLSVFVGNLDFAGKEEDLRVFFEGVMSAERGPPPISWEEGQGDDAVSTAKKPPTWVTRVRIVRDKDTQLGKGFAYVQFTDHECVDELLALEETKLRFAKRKLRVQRCKSAPGAKQAVNINQRREKAPVIVVPKGDPRLDEKLHGLPKEERKQLKSSDADRVARRLAKKKARMAMAPGVRKSTAPNGKDRKRAR